MISGIVTDRHAIVSCSVVLPVHQATIFWDGVERDVRVFATGRRPLIGTALLNEQELVIQFTEGGLVMIEEL
ncbi:MAG: hypothetical protein HC866_20420 [Leptolyngbyaceae cyanobacterium RU_5_1]|nr:hypothetical protein [Leptolyngbyaceae cyanobacterium RU_5_1]